MKNTLEFWQRVYANYSQTDHAFICFSNSNFRLYWSKDSQFKSECFRLRDIFLEQYQGDKSFLTEDSDNKYTLFSDGGGENAYYQRREIRKEFLKWMIENHHLSDF